MQAGQLEAAVGAVEKGTFRSTVGYVETTRLRSAVLQGARGEPGGSVNMTFRDGSSRGVWAHSEKRALIKLALRTKLARSKLNPM